MNLSSYGSSGTAGVTTAFEESLVVALQAAAGSLTAYTDLGTGMVEPFADSLHLGALTNVALSGGLIAPTSSGGGDRMVIDMSLGTITGGDYQPGYPPTNAVDNNISTLWSGVGVPNYLQYEHPTAFVPGAYSITAYSEWTTATPAEWTMHGSNDGSNWTELDSQTGVISWSNGEAKMFPVSGTDAYSYYLLSVTAVANGTTYYVQASEINFYESAPSLAYDPVTIVSIAGTAGSVPTCAMGVLWLDANGATLVDPIESNNAIRLYLSRDGGATWDWMPLADGGADEGDVRRYVCEGRALHAQPGTDICYKITSHDLGGGAPDFELHTVAIIHDGIGN